MLLSENINYYNLLTNNILQKVTFDHSHHILPKIKLILNICTKLR